MKKLLMLLPALMFFAPAMAQKNHNFEVAKHLDIFNSLYQTLNLYYVDSLDAEKNIGNAIGYMLDRLDPYTEYYSEENTRDLRQMTTGKYAGIGSPIVYRKALKRCIFSFPYEGMPAYEAGVRSGDIIMAINGKDVGECLTQEIGTYTSGITNQLRGEPGTTFELKVKRPATNRVLTLRLTRRTIELPSVIYSGMMDDSIGYVLLRSYTENTVRDLRRALVELKTSGMKRLVLDLRSNPGGLMREAVNMVNLFLPRGKEVLSTKGKIKKYNMVYKTTAEPFDTEMPIAVLVDYGTASAAEITSGALQDYDRAVVIGQRTFGKGLVQEPRELPYKTMLKLTTSKYYIPSGRCIQAYDFKNRNADGQPRHLPDSLCKAFTTAAGRTVYDGGGITPDVTVEVDSLPTFLTELKLSDALFDYCANYCHQHKEIAPPAEFRLTDEEFQAFKDYLKESDFTYSRRSKEMLDVLKQMAQFEGYAEDSKAEFDALEKKLVRNLDDDLTRWETEVRHAIESTIIANCYHEHGTVEYEAATDKELKKALEILRNDALYQSLLQPKK